MPQSKKVETIAVFGLLMQLVFLGICYALYSKSNSLAVLAQMWFLAPGALVWLVVLLHGRQRRLALQEREEMEELRRRRISEEIFEEQELDRMRAQAGLAIFERYFVPAFSIVLSGLLLYLAYRNLWDLTTAEELPEPQSPLAVVMGMAVITFFGFLVGKYAVGLAHAPELRLLRAAGAYLMGNVGGSLLLVLAMSMMHFGVRWLELGAAYVIPGLMALIAVEIVLNQILEIYRPRAPGQERRPAYDSRLLGLFAEPGDIVKTLAATLDYQFGFKISETWFYRFMARAIIPLVLVQLATLWLLSSILVVDRGEVAFIERLGRPRLTEQDAARGLKASVFGPGYHLKAPWPIEVAHRIAADRIYRVEIGKILRDREEIPDVLERALGEIDEDVILWRERHVPPALGEEADFLVPSVAEVREVEAPALNLARVSARVHFRIKRKADGTVDEAAVYDFYYRHSDPLRLVEDLGFRAMCRLAASQNFLRWIHVGRGEVSARFRQMFQESLDREDIGAGIELLYAGIPAVHPPANTAGSYEGVINAYEEKERMRHEAEREAVLIVNEARARSAEILAEAESYTYRLKQVSAAEAERFGVQLGAFLAAPEVYRYRQYLAALEQVLEGHRVIILPESKDEVLILDTGEKISTDILDIDLESAAAQ